MAIILGERARAAVARRRTRGWDTTLFLRHEVLPVGRGDTLAVGWAPRRWPRRQLEVRQAGDITVVVGQAGRPVHAAARRDDLSMAPGPVRSAAGRRCILHAPGDAGVGAAPSR
jgi:hypothetical protein